MTGSTLISILSLGIGVITLALTIISTLENRRKRSRRDMVISKMVYPVVYHLDMDYSKIIKEMSKRYDTSYIKELNDTCSKFYNTYTRCKQTIEASSLPQYDKEILLRYLEHCKIISMLWVHTTRCEVSFASADTEQWEAMISSCKNLREMYLVGRSLHLMEKYTLKHCKRYNNIRKR